MTAERPSVVITGASSGIGRACALQLAQAGWQVFAGVRRQADAERLQHAAIVPLLLDVTSPEQLSAAAASVAERTAGAGLRGLVNNAGIAVPAPVELLPLEQLRTQLEINLVGAVATTQAFLPLLRRSPAPGTIINMSSISGRVALPMVGAYTASKFALEAISDALRVELRPWGIQVVLVEPGTVATPIWEKTLRSAGAMLEAIPETRRQPYQPLIAFTAARIMPNQGADALAVARVVARALSARRPRARYVVGHDARLLLLLRWLPVRLRDWLIATRLPRYGG